MKRIGGFLILALALAAFLSVAGCGSSTIEYPDGDLDGDGPDGDTDGDVPDGDEDGDLPDGDEDGDGEEDGEEDGDAEVPVILFDRGEAWTVLYGDDADAATPGVQIDIALSSERIEAGTEAVLSVNGTDLDPVAFDADGKLVFAGVTLRPGANTLSASATVDEQPVTAEAVATLTGCRLTFTAPVADQALSDAGGDCTATCGDDLDCAAPNLQYTVVVEVENLASGRNVTLTRGGLSPVSVQVSDAKATFEALSLPHGDALSLLVSAETADGETCETTLSVDVELTCDCRLTLFPIPEDYNADSDDEDTEIEGFQRRYVATSENCLDGSDVTFTLNDAPAVVVLANQEAEFVATLPDGAYTLDVSIEETDSGRIGALVEPYTFNVDRTPPEFVTILPADGSIFTILSDLDHDLSNGIQVNVSGVTDGMEDLDPPLEAILLVNGVLWGEVSEVVANAFAFPNVTLPAPARATAIPYELEIATSDAAGNISRATVNLVGYMTPPSLVFTEIGGKLPGQDEDPVAEVILLNADQDDDTETEGLQTTLTAQTSLVETGAVVNLRVNGQGPIAATVDGDGKATWEVDLPYGTTTFTAETTALDGESFEALPLDVWADAEAPDISVIEPEHNSTVGSHTVDVRVYSEDAEPGQAVTLWVNGSPTPAAPQPLDDNGFALFEDVTMPQRKVDTYVLTAHVTDRAGNQGQSAPVTLRVDAQDPVVSVEVQDLVDGVLDHKDATVVATVTDDDAVDGRTVTFKLYRMSSLTTPYRDTNVFITGTTATTTFTNLPDNNYRILAEYTDLAENKGEATRDFNVDTGCFTVELVQPENNDFFNVNTVDVIVQNVAGGAVPVTANTSVYLEINGDSDNPIVETWAAGADSHTFQNVPLTGGANTLSVNLLKNLPAPPRFCPAGEVTVTLDQTDPVVALTSPSFADPLKFNKGYPDLSGDAGFQTTLTFQVTDANLGDQATLTVRRTDNNLLIDTRVASVSLTGTAVFPLVTLQNADAPERTPLTVTVETDDQAGNTGSLSFGALVDRTSPQFSVARIDPPPGTTLNAGYDEFSNQPDFQLRLRVYIAGGHVGGHVSVLVTPSDPMIAPYAIGPFSVVDANPDPVIVDPRATIRTTLVEGGYTFAITHIDDFGNPAVLDTDTNQTVLTVSYEIDYFASLTLFDKRNIQMTPGQTYRWGSGFDLDATPAFSTNFGAETLGMETGAMAWLCSDVGLEPGFSLAPACAGLTCTLGGPYQVVACAQVTVLNPVTQAGFAGMTAVKLANENTHTLYLEGEDSAGNTPQAGPFTVIMDSIAPVVTTFTVTSNDVSNDNRVPSPNVLLTPPEGTVSGSNLLVDVRVTSASDDAVTAYLYVNSPTTPVLSAPLVAGEAIFSRANGNPLVLPNKNYAIYATVEDDIEGILNGSNLSTPSEIGVYVDTVAPTISFDDGPGAISLNQNNGCANDGTNCRATVDLRVTRTAEDFPLIGGVVRLLVKDGANYTCPRGSFELCDTPITVAYNPAGVVISVLDYPLPQGNFTLSAWAIDPYGNASTPAENAFIVDSLAPTVAIVAPASDGSYDGDDNDDVSCGDGGGLGDLKLRRCDWTISLTDVNASATYWLQWRYQGGSWNNFLASPQATGTVTVDTSNLLIQPTDFRRGVIETRVRVVEAGTGNIGYSPTRTMTVAFDPPGGLYIQIEKLDATLITDGTLLNADDDTDPDVNNFKTSFAIRSNFPEGYVPVFTVNGNLVDPLLATNNGELWSGEVLYHNVPLVQWNPAQPLSTLNTLHVELTVGSDSRSFDASDVRADSQAPVLVFANPVAGTTVYGFDKDNDGQNNNGRLTPKAAYAIRVTSANIEDGQVATLKAYNSLGNEVALLLTATAPFTSGEATFSTVGLPVTNALPGGWIELDVEVEDEAGNFRRPITVKPKLVVDDNPPAAPSNFTVCVGMDSANAGESDWLRKDQAVCEQAHACNSPTDPARCDRNAGRVTLVWDAAANDADYGGTLAATGYEVQWHRKTATSTPCSAVTWNEEWVRPASQTLTFDPIAPLGSPQTAVISGLRLNTNTSWCVLVRGKDGAANFGEASMVGREISYNLHVVDDDLPVTLTSLGNQLAVGDLNNDGYDDFIINDEIFDGGSYQGRVYLYYGQSDPSTITDYDVLFEGAVGDGLGSGIAIGDINGDGIDDLVIGANYYSSFGYDGVACIWFGLDGLPLDSSTPDVVIPGVPANFESFGTHVEILDWNGTGTESVVISTFWADHAEGAVYMLHGRSTADWLNEVDGISVDTSADLVITRELGSTDASTIFGWYLGSGDFDGDGREDLVLSDVTHQNASSELIERAWVLKSTPGLIGSIRPELGNPIWEEVRDPNASGAQWAYYVQGIPDTNNDGKDEVLLMQGSVASAHWFRDIYDRAAFPAGRIFDTFTTARNAVYTAGDFNRNGYNDMVISGDDSVRVYWGGPNAPRTIENTDSAYYRLELIGLPGGGKFVATGGLDLTGDGNPDLVVLNVETGTVYLVY